MKKLFFLLLVISLNASAHKYFVSPSGLYGNPGTYNSPFKTLTIAFSKTTAGDTIYMRGGTYLFDTVQQITGHSGTASNMIKIWAYQDEVPKIMKKLPFWGNYTASLIYMSYVNYIHIRGLEICWNKQESTSIYPGLKCENVNYCKFEQLNIHNNCLGMIITYSSTGNLVYNCDFHNNYDSISVTHWTNGDGLDISTITDTNAVNYITKCRAWWNADDGFDFFNNDGLVVVDSCLSFRNGYQHGTYSVAGDGNGYKLGKTTGNYPTKLKRIITRSLAFDNSNSGYLQNDAVCKINLYNTISYRNAFRAYELASLYQTYPINHILRNNIAYLNGAIGYTNPAATVDHNTFIGWNAVNSAYTVTTSDFISLDTTGVTAPRINGEIPYTGLLRLAQGSDLINTGYNVGLPFSGTSPDLGTFEYVESAPPPANSKFVKYGGKFVKYNGKFVKY